MEVITNRQGFTLLITFTMCNAYSMLFGTASGRDVWISHIVAGLLALLVWYAVTAQFEKHGHTSFFDMLDCAFGKIFGHIICGALLVYSLLSATTSLGIFSRFTQLTSLSKTPQIILPLLLLLLAAWALKSGIEVLARGAGLFFYFALLTFVYFVIFGIPLLDARNITPVFENGVLPTFKSALTVFTNQFGDLILLLAIYPKIKNTKSRRKVQLAGLACAVIATSIIALFTVMTIGPEQVQSEFFPVFTTLSIRNVAGFVQHTEILTSIAMTFFVFIRQTVTLYFAANALAHLFHLSAHERLVTPLALLIASGTQLLYFNMMSLRSRIEGNLNLYILLPLQFLLPCIMCLILRAKEKKT